MPIARVQLPDGRIARFDVPDGTTPQQVESYALEQLKAAPAPASTPEPSLTDRAERVAGLGARAVVKGATAIPSLMADAAAEGVNLGIEGLDKLGAGIDYRMQKPSAVLDRTMTQAGLPEPANATERTFSDVTGAMVGAALPAKVAEWVASVAQSPLAKQIAEQLAKHVGLQIVSAGTGTASGDIAKESGAGPVGQTVATVAGSIVPAVAQTIASGAVRGAIRGGEEGRQTVARNLQTFGAAGTTPTVGQATEKRGPRLAETMLSKTPGSAGVMTEKGSDQAAEIGAKVNELAAGLSRNTGAENAGRAIQEGITADKGFRKWFEARQSALYDKLDTFLKPQARVEVTNTKNALADLNADIPGAPNLSRFFKNAKIQGIEGALTADAEGTAGVAAQVPAWQKMVLEAMPKVQREAMLQELADGKLPYEAVKKLRTLVGREITNGSLVSEVPKDKWKALYGALSEDLKGAAQQSGPEAMTAWQRANDFTKAGIQRLETLDTVLGKRDPEDIFKAAISGTQEGATTLRAVMKSLPEPAQKSVAATVLKRLGIATPGNQNDLGDVFSTKTFLTNWGRLSPEAKLTLFSKYGPGFTRNLDQIAKAANNIAEGSRVFANPSGTEAAMTSRLGISGIILSTLLGHPGTAAAIGGGMVAANVGARKLMSNPDFVRWLADTTKVPSGSLQGAAASLETLARRTGGNDGQAMQDFAAQLTQAAK